jgi:hypothetical protein
VNDVVATVGAQQVGGDDGGKKEHEEREYLVVARGIRDLGVGTKRGGYGDDESQAQGDDEQDRGEDLGQQAPTQAKDRAHAVDPERLAGPPPALARALVALVAQVEYLALRLAHPGLLLKMSVR